MPKFVRVKFSLSFIFLTISTSLPQLPSKIHVTNDENKVHHEQQIRIIN